MGTLFHVGLRSNHLSLEFTMYIGGDAIDSNKHEFVLMVIASYMD